MAIIIQFNIEVDWFDMKKINNKYLLTYYYK